MGYLLPLRFTVRNLLTRKIALNIVFLGIDLAKNVFQLCGLNQACSVQKNTMTVCRWLLRAGRATKTVSPADRSASHRIHSSSFSLARLSHSSPRRSYFCVVATLAWPIASLTVIKSSPLSSIAVAKVRRKSCGAHFSRPACC